MTVPITHKFYAYLDAGWVDLTPYVLLKYGVQVNNIGIQSERWDDRIAPVGTMSFYLQSDNGNFDPKLSSASGFSGWGKGTKVKHVVVRDTIEYIYLS